MIKNIIIALTIIYSSIFSDTLELGNPSVKLNLKSILNKEVLLYNKDLNKISKVIYYITDAQLYKKTFEAIDVPMDLKAKPSRAFEYKTKLKDIACFSLNAKQCVQNSLDTKIYFLEDNKKYYLLPDNLTPIYDIIKFNY